MASLPQRARHRLPGVGPPGAISPEVHLLRDPTGKTEVSPDLCACVSAWSGRTLCKPWTAALQASPGFPRQEHWSGLPFPPPGDLPPGKPLSVLS